MRSDGCERTVSRPSRQSGGDIVDGTHTRRRCRKDRPYGSALARSRSRDKAQRHSDGRSERGNRNERGRVSDRDPLVTRVWHERQARPSCPRYCSPKSGPAILQRESELRTGRHTNPDRVQIHTYADFLLRSTLAPHGAELVVAQEITLGQLVAFNLIAMRLSAPIVRSSRIWPELQRTRDAVRRIERLLDEPVDTGAGRTVVVDRPAGEIQFLDVTVRYPSAPVPALAGVDFRIAPGEFVALAGASGAGKSTLVRALLGLCRPERGAVLVDGMRVDEIDGPAFRSVVGVVPQQAMLFTGSVYDNIALGDPGLGPDEVAKAAEMAGAREFIERLPDGYRTFVGERGGRSRAGSASESPSHRPGARSGDPRAR